MRPCPCHRIVISIDGAGHHDSLPGPLASHPPSGTYVAPEIKSPCSIRKLTVRTTSRGLPSRPRGVLPGLTIHVLEDGAYREATASVALPTWQARDIHIALNETTTSTDTIADLVRVGRVLGDREGTGPMDDAQVAGYMRRSHQVGQRTGFARGHEQGRAEGVEKGRAEGVKKGLEQQRLLLARQAAAKFGAKASARLAPLLARIVDPERLAEVGEGLLVCATEAELVARVEAVIESKAPPPGH